MGGGSFRWKGRGRFGLKRGGGQVFKCTEVRIILFNVFVLHIVC